MKSSILKRFITSTAYECLCLSLLGRDYCAHRCFGDADLGLPNNNKVGTGIIWFSYEQYSDISVRQPHNVYGENNVMFATITLTE